MVEDDKMVIQENLDLIANMSMHGSVAWDEG